MIFRYYYDVSARLADFPFIFRENNCLQVRGVILDPVVKTFKFSKKKDLKYYPIPERVNIQTEDDILRNLWKRAKESSESSQYGSDHVTAFSLTLAVDLTGMEAAEDNLRQHQNHFSAFRKYRLESLNSDENSSEQQGNINRADPEKFWMDLKMACYGRSFAFTENGYYALGPMITRPGNLCCVIFGARVPYIIRKIGTEDHYRLVGEAYVHGVMHGEVKVIPDKGAEDIILCWSEEYCKSSASDTTVLAMSTSSGKSTFHIRCKFGNFFWIARSERSVLGARSEREF